MTPALVPLKIIQGATLRDTLRIMQPRFVYRPITAIAATAPVRLTCATARMQVRDKPGGTLHLELSTTNGGLAITGLAPSSAPICCQLRADAGIRPDCFGRK